MGDVHAVRARHAGAVPHPRTVRIQLLLVRVGHRVVQVMLQAPPLAVKPQEHAAQQQHRVVGCVAAEDLVVAVLVGRPPKLCKP